MKARNFVVSIALLVASHFACADESTPSPQAPQAPVVVEQPAGEQTILQRILELVETIVKGV
ncbi:hypothetical protein FNU76_10295 [Chitinimonas arctica]|uniref:Uncharacterized protein n=1 Tax=Chitinimonas arctica TaxID=2594795 RepID=A0A516SEZ7_9NEIS|nr:hypothetical protein [Chitinimonas arctica]QDQ26723.1 hypothetical protein FNU76_10295 [Chitinimonas arctica]